MFSCKDIDLDAHWTDIRKRAECIVSKEPAMAILLNETVLDRASFPESLTFRITRKLVNHGASVDVLHNVESDPASHKSRTTVAVNDRDPACPDVLTPLLYFKGFQSLVCYRVSHYLWHVGTGVRAIPPKPYF